MARTFREDVVAYLIGDRLLCDSCRWENREHHAHAIVINSLYGFLPVCDDCGEVLGEPGDLADIICDQPRYGFRNLL